MNAKTGDPQRVRAEIELLESFFRRFGKEFKDSLSQVKLSVEEFGWADWYHYDLGVARTNELISIPDEGNCICRVKLDGSATLRFNNPAAEEIPLITIPRVQGIPFKRLYLTNTAQPGKELLLLIGKGDFRVETGIQTPNEINNYDILSLDLAFPRNEEKYEINARSLTLLEKPNDNWSIMLNSNKNKEIKGSDLDPGDIIKGDGAIPAYFKYLYFTNPEGSGTVRFFISRDLPYRPPTSSEETGALTDPSTDPSSPPPIGFPSLEASNWKFQQRLDEETVPSNFANLGGGSLLCVCKSGKVYKSEDYGRTWNYLSDIKPTSTEHFSNIERGPTNQFWGIIFGTTTSTAGEFCYTTDYGYHWTKVGIGRIDSDTQLLAYLGNHIWIRGGYGYTETYVWRSVDDGASWTAIRLSERVGTVYATYSLGNGLALASEINWIMYPTDFEGGILRSEDYGETWTKVSDIIINTCFCSLGNNVVLGGANNQVYRSTDLGLTWAFAATLSAKVKWLENMGGGVVLAATADGLLHKSEDYGETWVDMGQVNGETCAYAVLRASDTEVVGAFSNAKIYKPE